MEEVMESHGISKAQKSTNPAFAGCSSVYLCTEVVKDHQHRGHLNLYFV